MGTGINSIGTYLPRKILTNDELAELYSDWTAEKILEKTGVKSRHIASSGETALDLAVNAIQPMLDNGDIKADEIDFILFVTHSPDYLLPATACLLQDRLNIPKSAGALDVNLGCSGFIYGLVLAKSLVTTGIASNVLLVTSDTISKHIHPMDKSTRTIIGDGAAATLISSCKNERIGSFVLGTDGSGAENLIVPASGTRVMRSEATKVEEVDMNGCIRTKENLYMNGPEVFNFAIRVVPGCVHEVLERNGLEADKIDMYVFHQANKFMLDHLRRKLRVPAEKFYINMVSTGNTASASIPIALKMAEQEGRIKPGDKIMLAGFGVGFSWGAVVIDW